MSTRSTIAREHGTGFKGVYHHWDGYPSGLGHTLFHLYRGHFKKNLRAMLRFLIDDHPQGWSTIVNADFTLPAGPRADRNLSLCEICHRPLWTHYRQYYGPSSRYWVEAGRPPLPDSAPKAPNVFPLFDHQARAYNVPEGPQSFGKSEDGTIDHTTAAGSGCEWAYVFNEEARAMFIKSSEHPDGSKMIGMFGSGNPEATWQSVAIIELDNPTEPDWKGIEQRLQLG